MLRFLCCYDLYFTHYSELLRAPLPSPYGNAKSQKCASKVAALSRYAAAGPELAGRRRGIANAGMARKELSAHLRHRQAGTAAAAQGDFAQDA